MKSILVSFLLLGIVGTANAAKIESLDTVSNKTLARAVRTFNTLEKWDIYHDQYSLWKVLSNYKVTNKKEKMVNTIKQMVYTFHVDYSKPKQVVVKSVRKRTSEYGRMAAAALANSAFSDAQKRLLMNDVEPLAKVKSIQLYSVQHGNNFGDCVGLVAVDTKNKQMALLQSCYGE